MRTKNKWIRNVKLSVTEFHCVESHSVTCKQWTKASTWHSYNKTTIKITDLIVGKTQNASTAFDSVLFSFPFFHLICGNHKCQRQNDWSISSPRSRAHFSFAFVFYRIYYLCHCIDDDLIDSLSGRDQIRFQSVNNARAHAFHSSSSLWCYRKVCLINSAVILSLAFLILTGTSLCINGGRRNPIFDWHFCSFPMQIIWSTETNSKSTEYERKKAFAFAY